MKKLEDIPKKQVFDVPDGYFDTLPGKIQARIAQTHTRSFAYRYRLQYVIPAVVLLAAGIFWFTNRNNVTDAETILASVQTEALVAYLQDTDITTEDLLESIDLRPGDVQGIEAEIYELDMNGEALDDILDDYDMENF